MKLSKRQMQCMAMVAEGKTSKAIAEHLGLSPKTVDSYLVVAMKQLGASNRAHAVTLLREAGHL